MVKELLGPKYKDITFYCHKLRGYGIVSILKIKKKVIMEV